MKKQLHLQMVFIAILILTLSANTFSQDYTNLRTERRHAISGNIGWGLGLTYDVFLNSHINLEASASLLPAGFHGGIYVYPFRFKKTKIWTTYLGAKYGDTYFGIFNLYHYRSLYVPLGVHHISPRGLNFSADIGVLSFTEDEAFFKSGASRTTIPMVNFKIGYRFGKMINPKSKREIKRKTKNENRDYNIRSTKSIGIYVVGHSPFTNNRPFRGLALQYFLTEQLNLEMFSSFEFNGFGGGIQFHPLGKRKEMLWSPYIGFSYSWSKEEWYDTEGDSVAFSIPVGIIFIGEQGFSLACFVAYGISDYTGYDYSYNFYEETKLEQHRENPFVGLKIGFRF